MLLLSSDDCQHKSRSQEKQPQDRESISLSNFPAKGSKGFQICSIPLLNFVSLTQRAKSRTDTISGFKPRHLSFFPSLSFSLFFLESSQIWGLPAVSEIPIPLIVGSLIPLFSPFSSLGHKTHRGIKGKVLRR